MRDDTVVCLECPKGYAGKQNISTELNYLDFLILNDRVWEKIIYFVIYIQALDVNSVLMDSLEIPKDTMVLRVLVKNVTAMAILIQML